MRFGLGDCVHDVIPYIWGYTSHTSVIFPSRAAIRTEDLSVGGAEPILLVGSLGRQSYTGQVKAVKVVGLANRRWCPVLIGLGMPITSRSLFGSSQNRDLSENQNEEAPQTFFHDNFMQLRPLFNSAASELSFGIGRNLPPVISFFVRPMFNSAPELSFDGGHNLPPEISNRNVIPSRGYRRVRARHALGRMPRLFRGSSTRLGAIEEITCDEQTELDRDFKNPNPTSLVALMSSSKRTDLEEREMQKKLEEDIAMEKRRVVPYYDIDPEEYDRQAKESDGFDVTVIKPSIRNWPVSTLPSGVPFIFPLQGVENDPKIIEMSQLAIDKYNLAKGRDYKFVKILKANRMLVAGMLYYITFVSKDNNNDQNEDTFQAQVESKPGGGINEWTFGGLKWKQCCDVRILVMFDDEYLGLFHFNLRYAQVDHDTTILAEVDDHILGHLHE
ncbi:hypothetical protein FXO37_15709 [Capsicum annuum]|nr:hypothetical protein FXO37_15709 [Capsicum annuum]